MYYSIESSSTKKRKFVVFFNYSGDHNLERRNVERPIFRNFEIANIKITKDELLDRFIFELFFHFFEIIWILKIFHNYSNCKMLIFQMIKSIVLNFQILQFWKYVYFSNWKVSNIWSFSGWGLKFQPVKY